MMASDLEIRVGAIGRRARTLRLVFAAARLVAIAAAALLIAGVLDYAFRFQDTGLRVFLSASALLVVAWSFSRWLWPAVRDVPDALRVARRIEMYFPALRDRLTSALDFARRPVEDPWSGSADLRRAVVAETTGVVERLNLAECLDGRRVRRAIGLAALVCAALGAACWLDASSAVLALRRMTVPWAGPAWPRRHELALVGVPPRVVAGTDLELQVVDRNGRLPDRVAIQYWNDGDAVATEKQMRPLGDRMVDTLVNVTRPFRCRARGGDDDTMQWVSVDVVERTRLQSLEVTLLPPAYTGRAPEQARGDLRVVEGTEARVSATLSQPVVGAVLQSDTSDELVRAELVVAPGGRSVASSESGAASWIITRSGTYSIRFTHADGLASDSERFSVECVPDTPPVVTLKSPLNAAYVTPTSVVPIRATVTDDLGLQRIALAHGPNGGAETARIELWLAAGRDTRLHEIEAGFDLVPLGLSVGDTLDLVILGQDFKPGTGRSAVCLVHVISPDQLEDRLAQRRVSLLDQLAEALRIERETRSLVSGLRIDWSHARAFDYPDLDRLQAAELNQRQVKRLLGGDAQGALAIVGELLAELRTNRIDNPATLDRAEQIARTLTRLGERDLREIEHHLVDALGRVREHLAGGNEAVDVAGPDLDRVIASLASAETGQQTVVEALEQLLADLSIWDSYRRFSRELSRIRDEQQEITGQTNRLRQETVGREIAELDAAQRSELERAAARQRELARRFEKLQSRMEQMETRLADVDPDAGALLNRALEAARKATVAGRMREIGRNIESNQLGQAAGQQQQVADGLEKVLEALDRRSGAASPRSVAMLLQRVTDMLARQSTLARDTAAFDRERDVRQPLDRPQAARVRELATHERDLAIESGTLADQVSDMVSFQLALRMAAADMNRAADGLDEWSTGAPVQDTQRQAVRRLQQIIDSLVPGGAPPPDEGGPPPDQENSEGQAGQMSAAELKLIKMLQEDINDRTKELERRRVTNSGLSPAEEAERTSLAQQQGLLAEMVRRLIEAARNRANESPPEGDSTGPKRGPGDMID